MEVLLDGRLMVSRDTVHDQLAEKLSFPSYYGRNLDALYDVLSTYPEDIKVTLVNGDIMCEALGKYAAAMIGTFLGASRENQKVEFFISNENF